MKHKFSLLILDIVFVTVSFFIAALSFPATFREVIPDNYLNLFVFILVWVIISYVTKKYQISKTDSFSKLLFKILFPNLTVSVLLLFLFFVLKIEFLKPRLSADIIFITTILEGLYFSIWYAFLTSVTISDDNYAGSRTGKRHEDKEKVLTSGLSSPAFSNLDVKKKELKKIFNLISEENGEEVHDLIYHYSLSVRQAVSIISTTTRFNIIALEKKYYGCIVNLHRINDIQRINKFFESVNFKLDINGIFIGKAETYVSRKTRILRRFPAPLNKLVYALDFLTLRVWPKVPVINRLYFFLTRGRNRVISRAETLGRLYSCGFEVLEEKFINDELYFVVKKVANPSFPENPTYGPIIRLQRIGKDGKYFNVFKMRTMHPYAEYLQEYVFKLNNLQDGGKIKDDFRVTTIGKLMRKLWIDELPMFINVLRGEMKIVGVRPLSSHYFNLYSEELKQKRIRFKPGLVPPFYADMPITLEEIMASEFRYLEQYNNSPLSTDFRYFFKALKNIVFHHARSH